MPPMPKRRGKKFHHLPAKSNFQRMRKSMTDPINDVLTRVASFIDDEGRNLQERARGFVPQGGLDKIEHLMDGHPGDERMPVQLFERLSAFFDAGLMVQRSLGFCSTTSTEWRVTDIFW